MAAPDPDLGKKCKKTAEKMSENLYMIGNEPTLACYRIQEHVHKSGPMLIDKGAEMKKLKKSLQNSCYGIDYSIRTLKTMDSSVPHFQNIQELLKNALFMKQQLDYEANIKARVRAKQQHPASSSSSSKKSAFQRFSGSFDIPAALITSSISGISNSASTDFKELKSALSTQFKGQSTDRQPQRQDPSSDTVPASPPASDPRMDPQPSTSREDPPDFPSPPPY